MARAEPHSGRTGLAALTLGALGVVYGDIGTSPLYALQQVFAGREPVPVATDTVLGVLSLVFWALVLVVIVKYLTFVLRADNNGEGGILALLALLCENTKRRQTVLIALGIFGAALLYGDGGITPAISVLSAVEGLGVAAPALDPLVLPLTVGILLGLFAVQRHGTGRMGVAFGPVIVVWFAAIAALGLRGILARPEVLAAVDPRHAVAFFARHGREGFFVLGPIVLAVTGVEALYADLGHFGRRAIRIGWYAVVLPALLLSYFGQGALLLADPTAATNPFYRLAPDWARYPMVGLATCATIIASQALISAAFSLTRQAVQLGYLPRVTIAHTSAHQPGQIYVPQVNAALLVICISLVLIFRQSSNMAAAYGMAVVGTMTITTVLFAFLVRRRWGWSLPATIALAGAFLTVDLAFLGANLVKITHGGWFPLAVGVVLFAIMWTWRQGRATLEAEFERGRLPLPLFVAELGRGGPTRVPGTAVFMSRPIEGVPRVLLHHLKHNKVLHETVVLLSVCNRNVPYVPVKDRIELEDLGHGLFRVLAWYGFMETPSVPDVLEILRAREIPLPAMDTTFFLAQETLVLTRRKGMARWRKGLFSFLERNAHDATTFFDLPANRVVELGARVEL